MSERASEGGRAGNNVQVHKKKVTEEEHLCLSRDVHVFPEPVHVPEESEHMDQLLTSGT